VVYGGAGLIASQESSSYPTPPEMKEIKEDIMAVDETGTAGKVVDVIAVDPWDGLPSSLSSIHLSSPKRESSVPPPPPSVKPLVPPINDPVEQVHPPSSPPIFDPPTTDEAISKEKDPSTKHNSLLLSDPSLRSSTVLNPHFLKSYFDQSRLHHLSTWKSSLKTQMQALIQVNPPRRTRRTPRVIIHVDFDCFFCSVGLISRPELKEMPVCVGHGGGQSGEIASCNYVARRYGVKNGML
jgi:DNA repair protein REV1